MTNAVCLYQKLFVDCAEGALRGQGLPPGVCRIVSSYFADCAKLSEFANRETPERVVVWLKGLGLVPGVTFHLSINGYGGRERRHTHTYQGLPQILLFLKLANFSSAFNTTRRALELNPPADLKWPTKLPKRFESACCFHYLTCLHPRNDLKPEISDEQQREIEKLRQQDPVLRANLEKLVRFKIQKVPLT